MSRHHLWLRYAFIVLSLLQWMLGLVTTDDGDVPMFMRPLDGNSSDKVSICAIVGQVMEQFRASQATPDQEKEPLVVIDLGGYSQANMKAYNEANIRWCSRVPEASAEAKAALEQQPEKWQEFEGLKVVTTSAYN